MGGESSSVVPFLCTIKQTSSLIVNAMENAAQSTRPEARIIHLRTPETPSDNTFQAEDQTATYHRFTLEYIDQLLDEHFR
jgi:hypothetical protein